MARAKFQTLTEQMFYVLLCLREERCGADVLALVRRMTDDRVSIGSGTLYDLLEQFTREGFIEETKLEGRRRSYRLTSRGEALLQGEYRRLQAQIADLRPPRPRKPISACCLRAPTRHPLSPTTG